MQILSKLPKIGKSIFSVMSQLSTEYEALNLAQGFADFDVSNDLIEMLSDAMKNGYNQYAPSNGMPSLLQTLSDYHGEKNGYAPHPQNEITITSGATEAIYATITALIHPKDEVIIFDPSYDCYAPIVELNGGISIRIPLNISDFSIPWDILEQKLNSKTKLIIINSPHNPTGALLKKEDLERIEKMITSFNCFVLSDEVYHQLVFDGLKYESVISNSKLFNRSIAIFSFGKIFHATGWKVGYCIAPKYLTDEIRKVHQFVVFSVHTPTQVAIHNFLKNKSNEILTSDFFQKKRDYFVSQIKNPIFEPIKSQGSYFQLLKFKNNKYSDFDMAVKMTKTFKISSIPLSVFYENNTDLKMLRFCFAKKDETLQKAIKILNQIKL